MALILFIGKKEAVYAMDTKVVTKHKRNASLLSIIPGFGQFYNKQYMKGIILFVLAAAFLVAFRKP